MELTGIDQRNISYFVPFLFGEEINFENTVLAGVIDGGIPCGAAAMDINWQDNNAVLTSIYTIKPKRRMGAGRMMLEALIKVAKALELNSILIYGTSDMEGLEQLILSQNFETFSDGFEEVYSIGDLLASKQIARFMNNDFNKKSRKLSEFSEAEKDNINKKIIRYYPSLGIDGITDETLSFVIIDSTKDSKEAGAVLLCHREQEQKSVIVDLLAVFSEDVTNIIALFIRLMQSLSNEPDTKISFLAVNSKVKEFMNGVAVSQKGVRVFQGIHLLN